MEDGQAILQKTVSEPLTKIDHGKPIAQISQAREKPRETQKALPELMKKGCPNKTQ